MYPTKLCTCDTQMQSLLKDDDNSKASLTSEKKLTCRPKRALMKNITVHLIVIIRKIYNTNSGIVTGWHYMPSCSGKIN